MARSFVAWLVILSDETQNSYFGPFNTEHRANKYAQSVREDFLTPAGEVPSEVNVMPLIVPYHTRIDITHDVE